MDILTKSLAGIVGSTHVMDCPPDALPASWKGCICVTASPSDTVEIQEIVRLLEHDYAGSGIIPVGAGLQLAAGYPPPADRPLVLLSLHRMNRITDHQPDDMTVTAEPGVTFAQCDAAIATSRQMLGIDVPRPERATLGGSVAVASHGLRRVRYGAVRDTLIGLKAVMQAGTEIKGGGKVVKNVAGYDLCKLFTGSYGSLGVLTEVTFRVHPCPEVRRTLAWHVPDAATAARVGLELHHARLAHTMLFVHGNGTDGYRLIIGFDGIEKRVNWQEAQATSIAATAGLNDGPEVINTEALLKFQNAPADVLENAQAAARISGLVTALPSMLQRLQVANPSLLSADISTGLVQIALDTNSHAGTQLVMNTLTAVGPEANLTWHHLECPETLAALPRWGVQGPPLRLHRGIKASLDTSNLFSPNRFPGKA